MTIEAQLPGGTTLQFPDGTPDAVVQGAVKQHLSQQPDGGPSQTPESKLGLTPAPPDPPKVAPKEDEYSGAPTTIDYSPPDLSNVGAAGKRGLGLGTRDVVEGAAALPGMALDAATWPMRAAQRAFGIPTTAPSDLVTHGLDAAGLPTPETPREQLGSAAIRSGAAAMTTAGAGYLPAVVRAAPAVAESLTTAAPSQVVGGLTGGTAGEATRQAGGGPLEQFVASVLGGGAGFTAANGLGPFIRRYGETPVAPVGDPSLGRYGPPKPPTPQPEAFVPPGAQQGPTLTRINELIQADIDRAARRPAEIPPTTTKDPVTGVVEPIQQPRNPLGPGQQAPQPTAGETAPPAGAQITPPAQAGLTPEQAAAAGSTADKQWYYKTVVPGEGNDIEWIKGINPTMAQREQTVNAARESKNLRRLSEDADQNERELLAQHTAIRKGEFQDIAGSDVTQQTDMKAASDQIERDLQAAYAHGGTVDLQPVINAAQAELTGSAGKLPPVKAAMKEIQDAAQKSDGSGLETDPRQANAVRRAIIYMQSREGRLANPGYGAPDVMAALTRVKDVLTKQVEPAAPGFTKANADYAAARQAADAREALQAYEPKLYQGPLGNMTFAPFHRLMGEVIAGRDPRAPMNPYKALTEEQFNRLKSLHESLQQAASAEELSRAAGGGSDTSQTLFDMAKKAARTGISTAGGAATGFAVGHVFGHEAGMAAGMFTQRALDSMFSQRAVAQATAEHNRLLRPDLTQYPLKPNPLMNPPPP